jgi:hypothetical protein
MRNEPIYVLSDRQTNRQTAGDNTHVSHDHAILGPVIPTYS